MAYFKKEILVEKITRERQEKGITPLNGNIGSSEEEVSPMGLLHSMFVVAVT